ncbi:MAG TPA: hypothetical protein VGM63_23580 [Mucilaginibacter sp.]|jgi:hypothetical protein
MKKYLVTFLIFSLFSFRQKNIDGVYVGLEKMCWTDSAGKKVCYTDSAHPERKWYHLSYLKIKGSKVFMDQSPVAIYKNDTTYSSSDGAFYYYTGKINSHDEKITINLVQQSCDYCPQVILKDGDHSNHPVTKSFSGKLKDDGLLLNGIFFRKIAANKKLLSEGRSKR